MNILLILGSALLPAVLLLLFIYHKDSKRRLDKHLLRDKDFANFGLQNNQPEL